MGDKHCQFVCPQQIAELNCAVFISTIEPNLLFNMKIRKKVILLASVGSIKEIYLSVWFAYISYDVTTSYPLVWFLSM